MKPEYNRHSSVVIIDGGYKSYDYERRVLERIGHSLSLFDGTHHDRKGRMEFAKNAVGMFCRWTLIDDEFLQATPNLKAIVRYGVGYDNIDLDVASARRIKVCNVQGYGNESVSDHALALIYACLRALPMGQQQLRTNFAKPPRPDIFELHDKTLGIIGLGRIGGTLCRKARNLFASVLACDPYIPDSRFTDLGAIKADLSTLLVESHVISLHCNLSDETRNMITRQSFAQMRQVPVFINTARGPIVDEDALLQALNENQVHSAGLDVYPEEPPTEKSDALLTHPYVIATGHYAYYSDSAMEILQQRAADNMVSLLQGLTPADCLNP